MLDQTSFVNSLVTICCSYLSLIGSILVLLSYFIARSKSTPKAAYLILHLAASDFFWFLASATQSTYWMIGDGSVPTSVCYICGPTVIFTRMASLLWTCAISFDVLMSVNKRKWSWKSQEKSWEWYRHRYYFVIFVFSFPGALLSIIKQHSSKANSNLGCDPGYEKLGLWYEVFFSEVFPIVLGFSCNLYVYFQIRKKMSQSAFPQSVRKRRKRIMYHYIIVCILCWIPTIVFYFVELMGFHVPVLEIIGRTSLYISGFLNFLVFGMQDPHLKRSFILVLHHMGLSLIIPRTAYYRGPLKTKDVEKVVMFEEATISRNADFSKDKKNIYRYHKLSKDDKKALYADRPDLDPKSIGNNNMRLTASSGNAALAAASEGNTGMISPGSQTNSGDVKRKIAIHAANCLQDDENSSRHSVVVLEELLMHVDNNDRSGDVENPLQANADTFTTLQDHYSLSTDDGGNCERRDFQTASMIVDDSLPQQQQPRFSSELLVSKDDRNSLVLNIWNINNNSGGTSPVAVGPPLNNSTSGGSQLFSAMHSDESAAVLKSTATEPLLSRVRLERNNNSSHGGNDDSDCSSEDESDEEDEELNAPV